jgi:MFS family permease
MKTGFRGVWQTPNLRKLVAARFLSNLGNGLGPIAIPFGVLALPNTNGTSLSMVWFANMLPLVGFTLIGGVIGDKFPRAQLVGGADILLGILVLANGITLISGHGALWIFIAVGFVGGFLNAIWYPSMGALTSDLADEKILKESNSSIMLSSNIAMIIGTSIGGGLVALYGAGWAIAIDGISFILAGLVVYSLRKHTPVAKPSSESTLHELKSGWKEFKSHKWIVAIVGASMILFACERSIYSIIGPLVAKENLGGPKPWAFILSIWSIGSVIGVLVAGKLKPKYPIRFALMMQFPSILWALALGNTQSILLIAMASFTLGIAMDLFYVFWITTIQQHVAKESLSKVLAYDAWGSMAMTPLIMGITGPITEYFGTRNTLNVISIICFFALALPFLVKEVRDIQASS